MKKIVGQFIVQILAALSLASLLEKPINWTPIIQNSIDVYRETIYPFWDFLFGWLGIELLDFHKDGFTLNLLLMIALSNSKVLGDGGGKFTPLFVEIWKQLVKMASNIRATFCFNKIIGVGDRLASFVWSIASAMASVWLMIMTISISFLIYIAVFGLFVWKILKSNSERKKYISKLKNLLSSTINVLYGFLALLGINFAILGIG